MVTTEDRQRARVLAINVETDALGGRWALMSVAEDQWVEFALQFHGHDRDALVQTFNDTRHELRQALIGGKA